MANPYDPYGGNMINWDFTRWITEVIDSSGGRFTNTGAISPMDIHESGVSAVDALEQMIEDRYIS